MVQTPTRRTPTTTSCDESEASEEYACECVHDTCLRVFVAVPENGGPRGLEVGPVLERDGPVSKHWQAAHM